jgi:hypothetical protein
MAQSETLAARNSHLYAQRRNALKVSRRAARKIKPLTQDNKRLLGKLKLLVLQLNKQQMAQAGDTRRYKSKIEHYRQLKTTWKKSAYAAEESRRYMLAKKSKHIWKKPFFNTKSSGAYTVRI